jgi:hypothetical protein
MTQAAQALMPSAYWINHSADARCPARTFCRLYVLWRSLGKPSSHSGRMHHLPCIDRAGDRNAFAGEIVD